MLCRRLFYLYMLCRHRILLSRLRFVISSLLSGLGLFFELFSFVRWDLQQSASYP
jgi:hypothetical protein